MRSIKPDPDLSVRRVRIPTESGSIPALILSPKKATGILWIHGGGYIAGMKEMVHMSRAVDLVKNYGAVVVSPGYRLAFRAPYPAAADDCYAALRYLKENASALGVRNDQIMVGGESAGGGLCAAICIRARDTGEVNVAFQMPLYPMLDDRDTESSRNNHSKIWNTRKNRFTWNLYLRRADRTNLSPYAAPARLRDFAHLPPAYFRLQRRAVLCGNGAVFRAAERRGHSGGDRHLFRQHARLRHDAAKRSRQPSRGGNL